MDHYEALGVSPSDSQDVIRRAYLAAARDHHPDFHVGDSEQLRSRHARRMQELNDAWAVLGDPAARSAYDRHLVHLDDPGVARRAAREPTPPVGKGWTPRPGDDGWMDDFGAWADERDELAPDVPASTAKRAVTVLPVGLFALAVASFFLGAIIGMRELQAVGIIALVLSIGLFFFLPIWEMTRTRNRS